jgi:hypothetical protein
MFPRRTIYLWPSDDHNNPGKRDGRKSRRNLTLKPGQKSGRRPAYPTVRPKRKNGDRKKCPPQGRRESNSSVKEL